MAYLIDSDWVVDFLANEEAAIELVRRFTDDGLAISIISYMEVYEGIARAARSQEAERKLETFTVTVPVLPLSLAMARRCGLLRADLRKQGRRVKTRGLDLLIAATAIEHNLTLVTRNVSDYRDIPGIRLYAN